MERELWRLLYWLTRKLDNGWGEWRYSASDVLGVYYWAVVHDRPISWAADIRQWPVDLRPASFPSTSTLYRRLRRPEIAKLMAMVEQRLMTLLAMGQCLVHMIDGKALAVSAVSKDPDAGYGHGAGAHQKGYKLHAIWSRSPMPSAWEVAPMNASETLMARSLISKSTGSGYLVGDTHYDSNYLYDLATQMGFQLVAKKRRGRGLGSRRHSPARLRAIELLKSEFGRALYKRRNAVESCFSALCSVGGGLSPLPAWVRRIHRVRNWVQTKILLAGIRWILRHQPQTLVDA
jgi:hypothetical protein